MTYNPDDPPPPPYWGAWDYFNRSVENWVRWWRTWFK